MPQGKSAKRATDGPVAHPTIAQVPEMVGWEQPADSLTNRRETFFRNFRASSASSSSSFVDARGRRWRSMVGMAVWSILPVTDLGLCLSGVTGRASAQGFGVNFGSSCVRP